VAKKRTEKGEMKGEMRWQRVVDEEVKRAAGAATLQGDDWKLVKNERSGRN